MSEQIRPIRDAVVAIGEAVSAWREMWRAELAANAAAIREALHESRVPVRVEERDGN